MQIEDNGRLVHTFQIAEGDVTAVVMRQNRKTIGVGLTNDGMPCLSIPRQMTIPELRRFLQDHRRMIRNMEERQRRKEEAFQEARKNRLTQEDIDRLGKAMCQDLPPRLKKYAQIIGVNYSRVTVRNQRTRWGSCSSRGSLNFNCLLMLAPENAAIMWWCMSSAIGSTWITPRPSGRRWSGPCRITGSGATGSKSMNPKS